MSDVVLTFLIPTWNRALLLARAITSVLTQPLADGGAVEIIVVDDGSTDATPQVMEAYTADPRVRYLRQPENRGVAAARNAGIRAASGAWIVLLDSDNALLPDTLPKLMTEVAALPGSVGIFWGNCRDSNGALTVKDDICGVVPGVHVVEGRYAGEHFSVVRTTLARKHPFAELGTRNECAACFWFPIALESDLFKSPEPYQYYETEGEDRVTSFESRRHRAPELVRCFEETSRRFGTLLQRRAPAFFWGLQGRIAFYRSIAGDWGGGFTAALYSARGWRAVPGNLAVLALCAAGPWATRLALRQR